MSLEPLTLTGFLQPILLGNGTLPPFFHTAKAKGFLGIMNDSAIKPAHCPVFGEDLAYLFAGRPAYKSRDCAQSDYWLLPIIFALKPPIISNPKRVFPFDSGAFKAGLFGDEFSDFQISDFEAPASLSSVRKLVDAFFGSNERYATAKPKSKEEIVTEFKLEPSGYPIAALAQMLNKPHNDNFDDRNSTIEVQFSEDVPVTEHTIMGVVLAEEWLAEKRVKNALDKLNCPIKTYPVFPIRRASYYSKIYELCQEIGYV